MSFLNSLTNSFTSSLGGAAGSIAQAVISSALGGGFAGFGGGSGEGWKFITAPEDVSWNTTNEATRVDMFGTNNPPIVAGRRGMRDLTLSNALVEGFVRKVSVEEKILKLEELMDYKLNSSDGFVSVPVYQVWANSRSYGGSEAYYIIKSVSVKETMRDLQGKSTRAYVDVEFMQIPKYQVNSGRDQAGAVTSGGAVSPLSSAAAGSSPAGSVASQANQSVAGSVSSGGSSIGNVTASSGASAPAPAPVSGPAAAAPGTRQYTR